jgi:hypothetical protein
LTLASNFCKKAEAEEYLVFLDINSTIYLLNTCEAVKITEVQEKIVLPV